MNRKTGLFHFVSFGSRNATHVQTTRLHAHIDRQYIRDRRTDSRDIEECFRTKEEKNGVMQTGRMSDSRIFRFTKWQTLSYCGLMVIAVVMIRYLTMPLQWFWQPKNVFAPSFPQSKHSSEKRILLLCHITTCAFALPVTQIYFIDRLSWLNTEHCAMQIYTWLEDIVGPHYIILIRKYCR